MVCLRAFCCRSRQQLPHPILLPRHCACTVAMLTYLMGEGPPCVPSSDHRVSGHASHDCVSAELANTQHRSLPPLACSPCLMHNSKPPWRTRSHMPRAINTTDIMLTGRNGTGFSWKDSAATHVEPLAARKRSRTSTPPVGTWQTMPRANARPMIPVSLNGSCHSKPG